MPMGSYEIAPEQALESALKIVKEGRVQGVKLEGGLDFAQRSNVSPKPAYLSSATSALPLNDKTRWAASVFKGRPLTAP